MASEWQTVDFAEDARGNPWGIGVSGAEVVLVTAGALRFDAGGRDRFAKAWAEAGRRAEAHLEPAVVEAEIWCGLDGCPNGPDEHLWTLGCLSPAEAEEDA